MDEHFNFPRGSKMLNKLSILILIGLMTAVPVFSQFDGVSPIGANTAQDLYSPSMAGRGGFTTSRGGAPAAALNPAAEGDAKRMIFDIGYIGMPGFGSESGWGNAFNLGAIFPTRVGVFGGSFRIIQSPFNTNFPVETSFMGNLIASKELYPGLNLGIGLNIGYSTSKSLILSGDFGIRMNHGKIGPLENFTWAAVFRSAGVSWIPSFITPAAGLSFDFITLRGEPGKPSPFRMGLATDIYFPSFQNVAGKLGLNMVIADLITVSATSGFNIHEIALGKNASFIPSIGIMANIKFHSSRTRKPLLSDGELAIDFAAKPLYENIWGFGGGVTWTLGAADNNPPVITVDYPHTQWISPNYDRNSSYLEFPVSITDERYIVEWVFQILDESNQKVRTFRNTDRLPAARGFRDFGTG